MIKGDYVGRVCYFNNLKPWQNQYNSGSMNMAKAIRTPRIDNSLDMHSPDFWSIIGLLACIPTITFK